MKKWSAPDSCYCRLLKAGMVCQECQRFYGLPATTPAQPAKETP